MIRRKHTMWWEQEEDSARGIQCLPEAAVPPNTVVKSSPSHKSSADDTSFSLEKGEMLEPGKQTVALPVILLVSIQ